MTDFDELAYRANFQTFRVDDRTVVLYEDHRSLLFVLWCARRSGILDAPRPLVTFDLHDDARGPAPATRQAALAFRGGLGSARDFMSFVEWELNPLDDDWLITAMDLDLVSAVVNVGAEEQSTLQDFHTVIRDAAGQNHNAWRIAHLWEELANQGTLVDHARSPELLPFWQDLGWDHRELRLTDEAVVLLDFDLDCFSMRGPAGRMAWPPEMMWALFQRRSEQPGRTAQQVLHDLLAHAPFVTIARESPWCGGTAESQTILGALDQVLFDGELFALR